MKRTLLAAIVAAGLLAGFGCSGGTGTSVAPAAPNTPAKSGSATFRLSIPVANTGSSTKKPAYVSAGTRSITFSGSGITTQTLALAPLPSTACPLSGGFYTCSLNFSAPVGNSNLTVATYASTDGSGTPLSINTVPISIVQDQTNSVPVTLNGVVSTLVLTLSPNTVTAGTSTAITASLGGKDAAGDSIVGPGAFVDASGNALTPTLQSSDSTNFAVGTQSGNSWPISYNGAAVAAPTITLIAGALANATQQVTVNPAPTSSPGGTNVITNGTFAANSFDGTNGWYRCYATRITTAGSTPINASPAPVNQLTVIAGSTAPPVGASTDSTQQSTTPTGTPPPSANAHFALVGYAGGAFGTPGSGKPNKGNTGICQDIGVMPASGTLTFNIFEGGDDNWSKSDSEADLYPAGTFTIAGGTGTAGAAVAPIVRLMAENNCYDSAGFMNIFLAPPWGSSATGVTVSSTARWSGCSQTAGGTDPGGYTPSSGGGFWYAKSLDVSSYAGTAKTLFLGIGRDAGASTPTANGAQYYNYAFFDNVALTGTGSATPPPLSVAPNPFNATQTGAATLTALETGYAGQVTITSDNTSVITTTTPATASGGSATLHVNVVNAGFANLTIKDTNNQTVVVPVTVTLTPVTIN